MTEQETVRISFGDAIRFLWRGLLPALIIALIGAAAVHLIVRNPTPVYRSTAILLATRPNSGYSETPNVIEPSQVDPDIYRSAVVHGGLLESSLGTTLGRQLTTEEITNWRRKVRVRVDEGLISGLIRIEVDDEEPALASAVANSLADSLLAWDRDRVGMNVQSTVTALHRSALLLGTQLTVAEQAGDEDEVRVLTSSRDQLLEQLRSAETLRLSAVAMGLLEPFRSAVVDPKPVNDRTTLATAAAFVLAFLLTYVVLFFRAAASPRLRSVEDLTRETGLEPVVVLPNETSPQRFQAAIERIAVRVQMLRRPSSAEGEALVVLVTSPSNPEERSLLALHLARSYVKAGLEVLVVDADLRHQSASDNLPEPRGGVSLSELLVRGPAAQVTANPTGVTGLEFIPVGSTAAGHSSVALARNMPTLINTWRRHFDLVIIDVTSLEESSDATAIASYADAVVLASKMNSTRLDAARTASASLASSGARNVLPVISKGGRRQARIEPPTSGARAKSAKGTTAPEARARVVQRNRRGV